MTTKISIADSMFIDYVGSLSLGGGNSTRKPTYFEWMQAFPQTARFVTDSEIKNARGEGQVALLLESFFLHPENYLEAIKKPFDYILTHNRYFSDNFENCLWYPKGGSWVALEDWGMHEKTKNISIILSPKATMPGHKLAHKIVETFGDKVDVFGLNGYVNKPEGLADYRFSIVIEAERCPGFFSEKLIDCLSVGTIPIYWGDPKIGQWFDDKGIIDVIDFDGIKTVMGMFEFDDTDYQSLYQSAVMNLTFAENFNIAEDWMYDNYPFLFGDSND